MKVINKLHEMLRLERPDARRYDCPGFQGPVRAIRCVDGFTVSVQANQSAYCTPRNNEGPYTAFELGYPSERPSDEVMEYVESPERPTDTVYGYVPADAVERLIDAHGGLAPEFAALVGEL